MPPIFSSKRFWSALIGLAMMIIVAFVPALQEHADLLIQAIIVVVGVLIGGYSLEDAARAMNAKE